MRAVSSVPSPQSRLQPLDNAEQDQALRLRLSHSLAHRPLQNLRHKLGLLACAPLPSESSITSEGIQPLDQIALQRSSLLADLQSYLLSLARTSLATTTSAQAQIAEYERQYTAIKDDEERTTQRIAGLKKQLEDVRRRRREKIEYGRVAESIERWFKTGAKSTSEASSSQGPIEIEESLATLLSHLTSSFLYNPDAAAKISADGLPASVDEADGAQIKTEANGQDPAADASTSQPSHSETLTLLYSKLDEMLNLSRQVREIVGWKPTSGSGPSAATNNAGGSASGSNALAFTETDGRSSKGGDMFRSGSGLGLAAGLNPQARSFEPSALPGAKRARTAERYVSLDANSASAAELEEGEELALPPSHPDSRKRKLDTTSSRAGAGSGSGSQAPSAGNEDEEEEGSIPSGAVGANAPSGVSGHSLPATVRGGRTSRSAGSRGGGR